MAIVAIDPGGTTGVAWTRFGTAQSLKTDLTVAEVPMQGSDTLLHAQRLLTGLERVNEKFRLEAVVIEDFILRQFNMRRELLYPVRIAAHLEALIAVRLPAVECVLQLPSDGLSVVTDERLKQWDLWTKGKPHGRAATKHLVAYLRKRGRATL